MLVTIATPRASRGRITLLAVQSYYLGGYLRVNWSIEYHNRQIRSRELYSIVEIKSLAHEGVGDWNVTGNPVTGCTNDKLSACSAWPSNSKPFHSMTPPYLTSPLIGNPRYWQCRRI